MKALFSFTTPSYSPNKIHYCFLFVPTYVSLMTHISYYIYMSSRSELSTQIRYKKTPHFFTFLNWINLDPSLCMWEKKLIQSPCSVCHAFLKVTQEPSDYLRKVMDHSYSSHSFEYPFPKFFWASQRYVTPFPERQLHLLGD